MVAHPRSPHVSPISRPHPACISPTSRLPLAHICLSPISRPHLAHISQVAYHHALVQLLAQLAFGFHNEVEMHISPTSRLHLAHYSPMSRLYLAYISHTSRLHLALCLAYTSQVEMLIQSVVPLDELCEHICDSFCPHQVRASLLTLLKEAYTPGPLLLPNPNPVPDQVRASFLTLLKEAYTTTQLKVCSVVITPVP